MTNKILEGNNTQNQELILKILAPCCEAVNNYKESLLHRETEGAQSAAFRVKKKPEEKKNIIIYNLIFTEWKLLTLHSKIKRSKFNSIISTPIHYNNNNELYHPNNSINNNNNKIHSIFIPSSNDVWSIESNHRSYNFDLKSSLANEDIEALVRFFDTSGDQLISKNEFEAAFRRARIMENETKILANAKFLLRQIVQILASDSISIFQWFYRMHISCNSSSPMEVSCDTFKDNLIHILSINNMHTNDNLSNLLYFLEINENVKSISLEDIDNCIQKISALSTSEVFSRELGKLIIELDKFMVLKDLKPSNLFDIFDIGGCGHISINELRIGLRNVATNNLQSPYKKSPKPQSPILQIKIDHTKLLNNNINNNSFVPILQRPKINKTNHKIKGNQKTSETVLEEIRSKRWRDLNNIKLHQFHGQAKIFNSNNNNNNNFVRNDIISNSNHSPKPPEIIKLTKPTKNKQNSKHNHLIQRKLCTPSSNNNSTNVNEKIINNDNDLILSPIKSNTNNNYFPDHLSFNSTNLLDILNDTYYY